MNRFLFILIPTVLVGCGVGYTGGPVSGSVHGIDASARLALYATAPPAAVFQTLEEEKKSNLFLQTNAAAEFEELRRKKDLFG